MKGRGASLPPSFVRVLIAGVVSITLASGCHLIFPFDAEPTADSGRPDTTGPPIDIGPPIDLARLDHAPADQKLPEGGAHIWSKRIGGAGMEHPMGIAVDGSGNVYLTGAFEGTVDFGGGGRTSAGASDIFVASYTSAGGHRWSKSFGGPDIDGGNAIGLDGSANVYVTGDFYNAVDFGNGVISHPSDNSIFVASYTGAGAPRWAKAFGKTNIEDYGYGLAVDGAGNVYVAGEVYGDVDLGGGILTNAGGVDVCLASYGSNGAHRWSKLLGGTDWDGGYGVATDNSGNVTITGYFNDTASFGGSPLSSAGVSDIFTSSHLSGSGDHRWSKRAGGPFADGGNAIAVDGSGNVTITGDFQETVNFGGGDLVSAGKADLFVASYSVSGAHRWSKRFGGSAYDTGYAIAVDGDGNSYVTGDFQDTIDFGGGALTAQGETDIFVASFTSDGTHRWSRGFGGSSRDSGWSVAVGSTGAVYVLGIFEETVDFGGGGLTSKGETDAFLLKLSR